MKNYFLSSLFILLSIISLSSCQNHVPKIQIYIESLCPDCKYLINRSLKDFYEQVKKPNLADVELVPYGNAKEKFNETTGKWDFTCQHHENECYGNLIETCLIQNLGRVDANKKIICIESEIDNFEDDFDKTLEYCLDNDADQIKEINDCVNSDMGNVYQHQMAQKTLDHDYVPWVLVDGVHDTIAEETIIESLIDYVCGDDKSKCYGE